METPSITGSSRDVQKPGRSNQDPSSPAAGKRAYRRYTEADKAEFFQRLKRLGSVQLAAQELGFNLSTCRAWAPATGRESGGKHTQAEKDEFFAVLDRVQSVSTAARGLGINIQTAFHWAYKAKAVTRKPRSKSAAKQPATQEQKDEFFAVLARVGSVTTAARQLGLDPKACTGWARQAGITGVRKREEFLRLRAAGVGRKEAAATAGASRKSAYLWDNGLIVVNGRAVRPDSDDQAYKQGVTTALAVPSAPETAAEIPAVEDAAAVDLERLERSVSGRYLSLQERETIADLLIQKASMRAISRELGRPASTISREIERNSHPVLGYQPYGVHRTATAARSRPKDSKLAAEGELREYVKQKLRIRWSPEQISNTLIKEFPDDFQMRVSHETIYQGLYLQARGGLKREVKHGLRTGRTRRKKHKNPEERTPRFRDPMINISERPPEVEDRAIPGHWEGDLITGTHNQSAIATLVERTTRYVMLVHLPVDHTAPSVRDGLIQAMGELPAHLRGSLTWDQGVEMALHNAFKIATEMDVYFCDPASPWQRGSNENTNGLLRQYFPKGTDLTTYGPEDLEHVAQELNARPRKTLGWDTPAQRLRDLLIAS